MTSIQRFQLSGVVLRNTGSALVPEFALGLGGRRDTGVVDQDVHAAPGLGDLLDRRLYLLEIGHVGGGRHGLAAGGEDLFRPRLGALGEQIVDGDTAPLGGQALGDVEADVPAGAGDEDDIALESQIHPSVSLLIVAYLSVVATPPLPV